jgi:uncharacterized protein YdhG (YjbR/CyaY superfamily)
VISGPVPASVTQYIAGFPPKVRTILRKIRQTVRDAAPDVEESISYLMPAYKLDGVLVYFAAFKNHIGLFPPVKGDASLQRALAPYAGPKGNLQFQLDEPIPYDLIKRVVKFKAKQNREKAGAKRSKR